MEGSLLKTASRGVVWTTVSTVVRSLVSLLQVTILTRYLSKEEFGIIAIATIFTGFAEIFMDMGISNGIMHRQNTTKDEYSSLFWLNVILGATLTSLIALSTPLIARLYNEPSLVNVLSLLSLGILFSSFGSQHRIVQQKNLRFRIISIIEITAAVCTLVSVVIFIKLGLGIYSLVFSTLVNYLVSNLSFLIIGLTKDKNVSFHFKLKETYPCLRIGIYSVASDIFNYFSREIDVILISATLGKDILGVYSLCKKIIVALFNAINPILTKVLTPLFALIQNEKSRIKTVYYDIVESVSLLSFPIYFCVALFSYAVLYYLYGESYTSGTVTLAILALYYGYLSSSHPIGPLLVALGKTDLCFYWTILRTAFMALAVLIGSILGINGIVAAMLIFTLLTVPIMWRMAIRNTIGGTCTSYVVLSYKPFAVLLILSTPFIFFTRTMTSLWLIIPLALLFFVLYTIILQVIFKNTYLVRLIKKKVVLRN